MEREREPVRARPDPFEPEDRELPEARDPLEDDREPLDEERDLLDAERDLLDEERDREVLRRRVPPLRSAAGISSRATPLVSVAIWPSRNFAIRSSSRRMPRASLAVSLSPTVSASVSSAW